MINELVQMPNNWLLAFGSADNVAKNDDSRPSKSICTLPVPWALSNVPMTSNAAVTTGAQTRLRCSQSSRVTRVLKA